MARATGRTLRDVVRAPYHVTVLELAQLGEDERIEAALAELRAVGDASALAVAFHEPKKLSDVRERVLDSMGDRTVSRAEAKQQGAAIIALMAKLDAAQVAPEMPDPVPES